MKKLIVMTVFSIVGFTTYAQNNEQPQQEVAVEQTQDDFKKIDQSDLPAAISDAIKRDYPNSTISDAYVNKSEQYKVEVTLENGTSGSLYFDKDGNSIDM
ncbi:PepSY-like domain-containing protein [Arenibacter palladensis]|uniref:PepSY-like domain-containing protein n=1 Tax=Arenibacter palladensis TaxID=237373 RepID=UPI002FD21027